MIRRIAAAASRGEAGFSLIEVLISMLLVLLGVLGAVALQVQSHRSTYEGYERAQAMVLVRDMLDKLYLYRNSIACLSFTTSADGSPYVGTAGTASLNAATACPSARATSALLDWDAAVRGAAEQIGGRAAGGLLNARGCVSMSVDAATGMSVYTVAVAWQGNAPLFRVVDDLARPAVACGQGLYGDEAQRRVMWQTLRLAQLKN